MEHIDATNQDYKTLNAQLRQLQTPCTLTNCCGQRFLAAGMSHADLTMEGIPGNALGAYLNGARIVVQGNAQDAVGDTMNEGQRVFVNIDLRQRAKSPEKRTQ